MGTSIPLSISTVDFSLAENFIFQSTRSPEAETPLGRKNMGGGTSGAGGGWSSWSSGGSSWGSGSSGGGFSGGGGSFGGGGSSGSW